MSRCARPGCTGSVGPEGYCEECGYKARAGLVTVPPTGGGPLPAGLPTGGGSLPVTGPSTGGGSLPATAPSAGGGPWSGSGGSGGTGTSRSSRRGRLGAGLLEMPRVPLRDPSTVVMADPQVAEGRRFCGSADCGKPVGRSRDGRPGIVEGFCPYCRTPFSFKARLAAGDVVNGRYEIAGCLAYGGLGWIYLARDRNVSDSVSDRWVVLKGLINTGDADAMAAAVAERRFLVEVDHPNIVKIHDFVQHRDPRTGTMVGYIVMEYVGGRSLRDIMLARRTAAGRVDPLPLPEVLAYALEVLPALGYLHDRGLLFCDFKPDNVIHAEEQLKLIDLGAVRHATDQHSAIYGTPGYQAPEIAAQGPSVASDIYTVGRSLAVLSFDFGGFTTTYADRLPDLGDVPLLAREESYRRLLQRATHRDPGRRFASAHEMAEQVLGVLREVLSAADAVPRPAPSTLFTPERRAFGTGAGRVGDDREEDGGASVAAALPLPLVDVGDPGAGFLATLTATDPAEVVAVLEAAPQHGTEVALRLVRARIEQGDLNGAGKDLDALAAELLYDWRIDWYRAIAAIAGERMPDARAAAERVYDALPGEPAARLVLAVAAERGGDPQMAARHYARVWQTDHGFVSAAFGLARIRAAAGDRAGAVSVLDEVPDTSSQHLTAQVAALRAVLSAPPAQLAPADLVAASDRLERLRLDAERRARLSIEVLTAALDRARHSGAAPAGPAGRSATSHPNVRVLGWPLSERALRFGLERALRSLAKLCHDVETRTSLVDRANTVRPRTLT